MTVAVAKAADTPAEVFLFSPRGFAAALITTTVRGQVSFNNQPITLSVALLWCDLGCHSRTVVVIKLRRTSALVISSIPVIL